MTEFSEQKGHCTSTPQLDLYYKTQTKLKKLSLSLSLNPFISIYSYTVHHTYWLVVVA
jgi:hypothetical protein